MSATPSPPPRSSSTTPGVRITQAGSHRANRLPKRVKQSPSPYTAVASTSSTSSAGSSGPSRSRTSAGSSRRPFAGERRANSVDRTMMTSPCRSPDTSMRRRGLSGRRREMSVPLLSHTLSHFSLSQSSSPLGNLQSSQNTSGHASTPPGRPQRHHTPSSSIISSTPRRHASTVKTPHASFLPRDHVYPSTAPLPHLPAFLGSPFSTTTTRGRYLYDRDSPSKGVMTERIGQSGCEQMGLDWLGRSEWMVDEATQAEEISDTELEKEDLPPCPPQSTTRSRRDTSGSTSSNDDFSGSGTSSASLLSLGRNSGEQNILPNIVQIWDEQTDGFEGEDEDPATPSRHLFALPDEADGAVLMSTKRARLSPRLSPSVDSKVESNPPSAQPARLRASLHSRNPSPVPAASRHLSPSPAKPKRSPISDILPRLISSSKKSGTTNPSAEKPRTRSPLQSAESCLQAEEEITDTEEVSPDKNKYRNSRRTSRHVRQEGSFDSSFGDGIGLGIQSSAERAVPLPMRTLGRTTPFSRSLSSESSGETDVSPSKFLSARASGGKPTPALPTSFTSPVLQARRQTLEEPVKVQVKVTPLTTVRPRPIRPALRRGIIEARGAIDQVIGSPTSDLLTVHTPFAHIKPSPAAFASTGLVRKKSTKAGFEIPTFGQAAKPTKLTRTVSPIKPLGFNGSSDVSGHIQAAQRTRGLRRKGSQMFASGSSGSIGDISKTACSLSPATPTKPGFRSTLVGLDVTTPSPTTTHFAYPFASSSSSRALHTPPSSESTEGSEALSTPPMELMSTLPARLRDLSGKVGPVARLSNPMLAASFRAHGSSGLASHPVPGRGMISGRLERDFVVVQSLGKGEFSHVWKVREKADGRLWAVKAGKPYTGYKNRLRQLEEVSILRNFSLDPNPHVVNFMDSWEHNDRLYIRTELAECGDLSRFLLSPGDYAGLGEARVWKTLIELSSGLRHVHNHNVLHLDLKPSNILITRTGSLKIADFGMSTISCPEGHAADLSPALPSTGNDGAFVWSDNKQVGGFVPSPIMDREVEGDREYLSPEALGDGQVGREADVFSLGILLLEAALNVVLPSNGEGWIKLRNDDFTDLTEHYRPRGQSCNDGLPEISDVLMKTVQAMMTRRPEKRATLVDVQAVGPVKRVGEMEGARAALVEEDAGFLEKILGGE